MGGKSDMFFRMHRKVCDRSRAKRL